MKSFSANYPNTVEIIAEILELFLGLASFVNVDNSPELFPGKGRWRPLTAAFGCG